MSAVIPQSESTKFSNLQLELLKLFSKDIPEEDLIEIKDMISKYLIKKFIKKIDEVCERENITQEDLDKWLNEES